MTVAAASLSLLLHVLPPYRPLIHRVRSAESIALVEITRQTRQQLAFEPKMSLHGEALKSARIQPGHKPSAKARFGLATFRRISGRWYLQDQAREWIELEPSAWRAHPPSVWRRWVKGLRKESIPTLLRSLGRAPFDQFAARDLNTLMLAPKRADLRKRVAQRLAQPGVAPRIAESLRHTLLRSSPPAERALLKRCLLGDKACVGR